MQKLKGSKRRQKIIEGKISTANQKEALKQNQEEINGYQSLRTKLMSDTEAALKLSRIDKRFD